MDVPQPPRSELAEVLFRLRRTFYALAAFSGVMANPGLFRPRWVVAVPMTPLQLAAGARLRLGVQPVGQIEEEQEGELFGVGYRVGITATKQVIADDFDVLAELRGQGHGFSLMGYGEA